MINRIWETYKKEWNLDQFITVDETMVRYKGKYSLARQYMPKKPIKWGLKVWCAIDAKSKYVNGFEVYCGKTMQTLEEGEGSHIVSNLEYKVVRDLICGLENKGHVIAVDNFLTSIQLFRDLEHQVIYAIGMMRSNWINLHSSIKNVKAFKKQQHGDLDWMMHSFGKMCLVIWKDKQLVLLLSTHAPPIVEGDPMNCSMPRCNGEERPQVPTSSTLLEYTMQMRGVDVADQLLGNHTWLSRSHKWLHRVFLFLWEMTTINIYIIYLEILSKLNKSKEAITPLQFQVGFAQTFTY